MFSNRTLLELIRIADNLSHSEIDRIISIFGFPSLPYGTNPSKVQKTTEIFNALRYKSKKCGPFTASIELDLLKYLVDDFFNKHDYFEKEDIVYPGRSESIKFSNAFAHQNSQLTNSLKLDGYTVIGRDINKLLPEEIEEVKTESELFVVISKYNFEVSKGHLNQAISNHSQGNWASANSQFRTFIESLLIEINNFLLPGNQVTTAAQAIKTLAETANPPFLSKVLNEYPNDKDSDSFVYGLWARLHPNGSHPGLSDEDDSSFRYHISIVFANYLLRRLAERKKVST